MNKKLNKILIFVLAMIMVFAFVGCTDKDIRSPEDVIKDAYGNTQFRISFDSTNLESPISDMFYTANNMPILPTPTKVGFVFAGWFFDASLTKPCDVPSGDLLWKMKDITLYPKWEEEQIVNKGTYEIEYNAKIIESSIVMGPEARDEYQLFTNDIISSETYIEKNDKGTFLRIQYDNRVRGPVLGGEDSDSGNFSKMTYTVTEDENRINNDISIFDRTSNIQTIYYDLNNKKLTDTIILHIEYYDWIINVPDELRKKATVRYDVEFNITRFIGFGQAFINPEGRLEDGMYLVPTHYTGLDKEIAMLDMFNPVYAYIEAKGGHYILHKQLSAYNNDFAEIKLEQYPLRTSGYAREFACMYIDQNKKIQKNIEEDRTGKYFIPEEIGAKKFIPLTYEFFSDTGKYYYSIDLGNTLDNDLVFIGGSAGAMEQMFSFPFSYRRLTIDYNSMVKLVDCDYKPLEGNEYKYRNKVAYYPGSTEDFKDSNKDYDLFHSYRHAIDMTNVFFTPKFDNNGNVIKNKLNGNWQVNKVYDTKMTISIDPNYFDPSQNRFNYSFFNVEVSAFGYDPVMDGELYARDLSFTTNTPFGYSNSFVNKKLNGKTYNIGDSVDVVKLYSEKVSTIPPTQLQFRAYAVDDNLKINYKEKVNIDRTFDFTNNIAILYKSVNEQYTNSALVYVIKKEPPIIKMPNGWTKNAEGIYVTDERFKLNSKINIPEVHYSYYGSNYSTASLKKYYDELYSTPNDDLYGKTDYTRVSAWNYSNGIYSSRIMSSTVGEKYDFVMDNNRIRVMMQLTNPFGEFETIEFEFSGEDSGYYEIRNGSSIIAGSDITYKGAVRNTINYNIRSSYHIENELDVKNIPTLFELILKIDGVESSQELPFKYAIIYTKNATIKVNSINDIWTNINHKDVNYALVNMHYANEYGDSVDYKAEYKFRIENKLADEYYGLGQNITIFNNKEFTIKNPVLSSFDYTILGTGGVKLYKKYGNQYEIVDKEDGKFYASTYYSTVEFFKSGKYLLCWHFELRYDQNGELIFDALNPNDRYNYVKFNICQEIEVLDTNADMLVTFATDKAHPFSQEAINKLKNTGYTYSEDAEYQYLAIKVTRNENIFAFYQDIFAPSKHVLFGWGLKNGKRQFISGNNIGDVGVMQNTLKPVLYALWNIPIEVDLTYDIGGHKYKPHEGNILLYREESEMVYSFKGGKFKFMLPDEYRGYEIYGWESNIPIFEEYVEIDGHRESIYTTHVKGNFDTRMTTRVSFELTAIFKKKAYISYDAVDTNGIKHKFNQDVSNDYNLFVTDKYIESISKDKYEQLNRVLVDDINLKLVKWTIYDNKEKKYMEINLNTLVLEDRYVDQNGKVMLRAVFG